MNLFQVKNEKDDFGWGAVINFQKKANQSKVSFICVALIFFMYRSIVEKKELANVLITLIFFRHPQGQNPPMW